MFESEVVGMLCADMCTAAGKVSLSTAVLNTKDGQGNVWLRSIKHT